MLSSRSITTGLLALGFAAEPAFAAPDIYYNGAAPAEACADRVAIPGAASPKLKRFCEDALKDDSLTLADKSVRSGLRISRDVSSQPDCQLID